MPLGPEHFRRDVRFLGTVYSGFLVSETLKNDSLICGEWARQVDGSPGSHLSNEKWTLNLRQKPSTVDTKEGILDGPRKCIRTLFDLSSSEGRSVRLS